MTLTSATFTSKRFAAVWGPVCGKYNPKLGIFISIGSTVLKYSLRTGLKIDWISFKTRLERESAIVTSNWVMQFAFRGTLNNWTLSLQMKLKEPFNATSASNFSSNPSIIQIYRRRCTDIVIWFTSLPLASFDFMNWKKGSCKSFERKRTFKKEFRFLGTASKKESGNLFCPSVKSISLLNVK